jgi:glycolate oxidase FAD binding subunit
VLADGTVAKAGGKVVKNVAGYDLCKLYTGSLGTLGMILDATFRLHPRPEASRAVVLDSPDPDHVAAAVQSIFHSALVPSALELSGPSPWTLTALFEGIVPGVEAQSSSALLILRAHGEARVADESDLTWLGNLPWFGSNAIGLKIATVPADLATVLHDTVELARWRGVNLRVSGHAGNGITFVALDGGDDASYRAIIREMRRRVSLMGGSVVVAHGPVDLRRAVDTWGPGGDALALMRRVKDRFDPNRIMNPGRYLGGI